MPTLIPLSEYGVIISFYFIIVGIDTDKFINIHLKKFNYKKIFYKEKITKFNKEEIVIKDL